MKDTNFILVSLVGLTLLVLLIIGNATCTAAARAAVARTIADIAAEVCIEGDSISVCLKKCETEASRREE